MKWPLVSVMKELRTVRREVPAALSAPTHLLVVVIAALLALGALALPMKAHDAAAMRLHQKRDASRETRRGAAGPLAQQPSAVESSVDSGASFESSTLAIGRAATAARTDLSVYFGADGERITVGRVERFLISQRSPFTRFASSIVSAGVRYHVDPRVVVAISGVESTFGRYVAGHNAWGWGKMRWPNWSTAIESYTRLLGSRYRSLRLGRFAAASRTYCPPCGQGWGIKALRIFRSI